MCCFFFSFIKMLVKCRHCWWCNLNLNCWQSLIKACGILKKFLIGSEIKMNTHPECSNVTYVIAVVGTAMSTMDSYWLSHTTTSCYCVLALAGDDTEIKYQSETSLKLQASNCCDWFFNILPNTRKHIRCIYIKTKHGLGKQ